ncbi:MAG TPA: hypothetical protein DEA08_12730 [Planctomycetes bacterium]|nr:hypothetical protein [Planctomycetota bacterium]
MRRCSFLALALCLLAPSSAWADYRPLSTSPEQDQALNGVLERAGPGRVVLFDLDSTLIDTRPRQVAVLRAWAAREGVTELYGLQPEHIQSWDWTETLKRAGAPFPRIKELAKRLRQPWSEGYWSDAALVHDLPMAGASAYLRALHAKGATLAYVGRRASQEAGTRRSLEQLGFPLGERARLVLDEVAEAETRKARKAAAKAARERSLSTVAALGSVVAAFENEGHQVDALRQRWPGAVVVHLISDGMAYTQSRGPRIHGWLRRADEARPEPGKIPDVPRPDTPLEVVRVPDGDTVVARAPWGEQITLRLIGIDTPEKDPLYERADMAGKKARHVAAYGAKLVADPKAWVEAKTFLVELLGKGKLHLRYDPSNELSGHRDSTLSRRVLAYLVVRTPQGDEIDVNAELCRAGYTLDYAKRYPHQRGAEFRRLVEAAQAAGRGYWSAKWQP